MTRSSSTISDSFPQVRDDSVISGCSRLSQRLQHKCNFTRAQVHKREWAGQKPDNATGETGFDVTVGVDFTNRDVFKYGTSEWGLCAKTAFSSFMRSTLRCGTTRATDKAKLVRQSVHLNKYHGCLNVVMLHSMRKIILSMKNGFLSSQQFWLW